MYSGVNYTTMGHTASCATATLPSSSYPVANMPKVGSASTTLGQGSAPALGANAGPDTHVRPPPLTRGGIMGKHMYAWRAQGTHHWS